LIQFGYFRIKTGSNLFFGLARVFSVWFFQFQVYKTRSVSFLKIIISFFHDSISSIIFFSFFNLSNFLIFLLNCISDQFQPWRNGRVLLLFLELICCLIISRKKIILPGFSTPFDGDTCCTPVECAAGLTFAYLQIWAVSTHYHCWSSTGYHPSYNQLALPHSK